MNPDFLRSTPKRIIRIAGQDYDLSQNELRELVLPPPAAQPKLPEIADNRPLIQPPMPELQPPPPPPPPPPPVQQIPPVVIGPEDVIAEGARPDAPPKPSRGDTEEPARVASGGNRGGSEPEPPPPPPRAEPSEERGPEQIARNLNPNALRLPNLVDRAGRIVEESIEESRRRFAQSGRTGIQRSGPEDPNFSTEEPTILSDTRGYDFGPYMNQVVNRVRVNWYTLIPEIARLGRKGRVVIVFTILESGTISDLRLVANSGTDPLDRAAVGAITASNPFPRLPSNFDGDHLVLQFTFLYNIR
jgi:TonB family protein